MAAKGDVVMPGQTFARVSKVGDPAQVRVDPKARKVYETSYAIFQVQVDEDSDVQAASNTVAPIVVDRVFLSALVLPYMNGLMRNEKGVLIPAMSEADAVRAATRVLPGGLKRINTYPLELAIAKRTEALNRLPEDARAAMEAEIAVFDEQLKREERFNNFVEDAIEADVRAVLERALKQLTKDGHPLPPPLNMDWLSHYCCVKTPGVVVGNISYATLPLVLEGYEPLGHFERNADNYGWLLGTIVSVSLMCTVWLEGAGFLASALGPVLAPYATPALMLGYWFFSVGDFIDKSKVFGTLDSYLSGAYKVRYGHFSFPKGLFALAGLVIAGTVALREAMGAYAGSLEVMKFLFGASSALPVFATLISATVFTGIMVTLWWVIMADKLGSRTSAVEFDLSDLALESDNPGNKELKDLLVNDQERQEVNTIPVAQLETYRTLCLSGDNAKKIAALSKQAIGDTATVESVDRSIARLSGMAV